MVQVKRPVKPKTIITKPETQIKNHIPKSDISIVRDKKPDQTSFRGILHPIDGKEYGFRWLESSDTGSENYHWGYRDDEHSCVIAMLTVENGLMRCTMYDVVDESLINQREFSSDCVKFRLAKNSKDYKAGSIFTWDYNAKKYKLYSAASAAEDEEEETTLQ